ncbi:MAG: sulfatase-like hydrolase/transferase [Akkermansiaceae bacterium]
MTLPTPLRNLLLAFVLLVPASSQATTKPNIIMIMSDDQGWGDVGFNGHPDLKTPHLDAMAANGVKFNRFYAASPLCSPTRGSCLTGRNPFRFGILAAHTAGMRQGEITIAEMLESKDYQTGFFGKWHIGWLEPDLKSSRGHYSPPSHHGFQSYFATTSAVPTWNPTVTPESWTSWGNKPGEPWKGGTPYLENGNPVSDNMKGDDSRIIMDRVIPFIEKNKAQNFFATVWFHAPHEPVVAGPKHLALYADTKFGSKRKNYYGCITAMDEQVGRLRKKLRELGLEKNTLLFFCSDNGPSDGATKKGIASAGPFKGHKHTMYEGGILVPACIEWPSVISPGATTDVRCSTVDFFPTIASVVDYSFSSKQKRPIDGIDLFPIVKESERKRSKDLFFGYRRLYQGISGMALIRGDYKILREAKKDGRVKLYNLAKDPYEKNDLSKEEPERLEELTRALEEIDKSCQLSRDGADYRY